MIEQQLRYGLHRSVTLIIGVGAVLSLAAGLAAQEPLVSSSMGVGTFDLSIDGDFELKGETIWRSGSPLLRANGLSSYNTSFGLGALANVTPAASSDGLRNTALGHNALHENTTGSTNTAVGHMALKNNTDRSSNTAVGASSLSSMTPGFENTALGTGTLRSSAGTRNTVVGNNAAVIFVNAGSSIAIGHAAGNPPPPGSAIDAAGLVYIGSPGESTDANGVVRLGTPYSAGQGTGQNSALIEGIFGVNVGASSTAVHIDSNHQLGVVTSAWRFKEEIQEIDGSWERLRHLRPVSFRYTQAAAGEGAWRRQYGLVAEEVASLEPELAVFDERGEPLSVRYHALVPLLLAELQRQERELAEQERILTRLTREAGESTPGAFARATDLAQGDTHRVR